MRTICEQYLVPCGDDRWSRKGTGRTQREACLTFLSSGFWESRHALEHLATQQSTWYMPVHEALTGLEARNASGKTEIQFQLLWYISRVFYESYFAPTLTLYRLHYFVR